MGWVCVEVVVYGDEKKKMKLSSTNVLGMHFVKKIKKY